jgi:hypothetical protein
VCEGAEPLILGVFEVPPEIWDDPYRTFLIGADLVIDAMIQSVKARSAKFVLIAKYVEHPVWDGAQHYRVQTVTLMNASDWRGGRQVSVRYMQECLRCKALVPYPGPDICPQHIQSHIFT